MSFFSFSNQWSPVKEKTDTNSNIKQLGTITIHITQSKKPETRHASKA